LGKLLAAEGNPEALSHFAAAVHLNSNLKHLHKDFGSVCAQLGRREEAMEHLKIAFQQDPEDLLLQDMLASLDAETLKH
jgi:predicted Zn-dependent protease